MYVLYLDSKCDDMANDFHQYSDLSIGVYTLTRNYWCCDKNDCNKKILFACIWDTRDPKNIIFSGPVKMVVWYSSGKHRERPPITIILFCWIFRGVKRPKNPGGTKNIITVHINCNTETCWESLLGVSIQVHVGGKKEIQAAPLPHGSETISAVFSSVTEQPAFSPFSPNQQPASTSNWRELGDLSQLSSRLASLWSKLSVDHRAAVWQGSFTL